MTEASVRSEVRGWLEANWSPDRGLVEWRNMLIDSLHPRGADTDYRYRLDIGIKTVETYKSRATTKLGLHSRAQIVRFAATQGWLADF